MGSCYRSPSTLADFGPGVPCSQLAKQPGSQLCCEASDIQTPAYEGKSGSIVTISGQVGHNRPSLIEVQDVQAHFVESHGNVKVDLLEDMQDKATAQLNDLRAKEVGSQHFGHSNDMIGTLSKSSFCDLQESGRHSFAMLQQSLQDEITFAKHEVPTHSVPDEAYSFSAIPRCELQVSKLKASLASKKETKTGDTKDLQELLKLFTQQSSTFRI